MERQPLSNGTTHGKPAKRKGSYPQRLYELNHIVAELVDGVVACWNSRRAVAARVIAEHAEVSQQVGHLWIPHTVVAAQRMRQHQDRELFAAFQPVEEANVF